jgi:hypothetical protein
VSNQKVLCVGFAGALWQVGFKGSDILGFFSMKDAAVEFARFLAQRSGPSRIIVYTVDGEVETQWIQSDHAPCSRN